jgi:phosphate transport system permease protein
LSSVAESESRRTRQATRRRVHAADRAASALIRVGGILVLVAVLGICVYLAAVVAPLFRGGRITPLVQGMTSAPTGRAVALLDEYAASALVLDDAGVLSLLRLDAPAVLASQALVEGTPSAWSLDETSGLVALAFDDGTLRLGSITFAASVVSPADLPDRLRAIPVGTRAVWSVPDEPWPAFVEPLNAGQVRVIRPDVQIRPPTRVENGSGPIHLIDYRRISDREILALVRADGSASLDLVRTIRPLGGGPPRVRLQSKPFELQLPHGRDLPRHLFVAGDGSGVLALWADGLVQRYAAAGQSVVLAEQLALLAPGRRVTSARMLLGGLTLAIGDDAGAVTTAFAAADPAADTPDHRRFVVAERFTIGEASIVAIGVNPRSRTIAIADAEGALTVLNPTSGKVIGRVRASGPVLAAALSPKLDALAAIQSDGVVATWAVEPGHPEASLHALFGRVHYEGEPEPLFRYQATSGEDAGEAKLSLVPLIHGTLKATIFAMLFAAPLAVLAAIYTSEFLDRRVRALVKPGVEMMASLPSVVLGFIAAIAVAPFVRDHLLAVILSLLTIPVAVLLGAHLWQLAPPHVTGRVPPRVKLLAMLATIAGGVVLAAAVAPTLEHALFAPTRADRWVMGDSFEVVPDEQRPAWIGGRDALSPNLERRLRLQGLYFHQGRVVRPVAPPTSEQARDLDRRVAQLDHARPSLRRWLDGNFGSPWPGWLLLLSPAALIAVVILHARFIKRRWDVVLASRPWTLAAALELARFASMLALAVTLASAVGWALTRLGLDTRDLIFGTFNQRNTLVVALIMGFAIIPIIYTISEDAMRAVPDALRSASLGAGATPWQTAVRVVLPVAGSGIFSACMIGLGRAVGETMIVLMATGNTPAMDWNIFSGFRTLSANIAVELPEAAAGSTHYRVLFLCGLVLFAMTFVVNSTAEAVRQRFRARSSAL